jgi:hypothetical protein
VDLLRGELREHEREIARIKAALDALGVEHHPAPKVKVKHTRNRNGEPSLRGQIRNLLRTRPDGMTSATMVDAIGADPGKLSRAVWAMRNDGEIVTDDGIHRLADQNVGSPATAGLPDLDDQGGGDEMPPP